MLSFPGLFSSDKRGQPYIAGRFIIYFKYKLTFVVAELTNSHMMRQAPMPQTSLPTQLSTNLAMAASGIQASMAQFLPGATNFLPGFPGLHLSLPMAASMASTSGNMIDKVNV